MIDRLPPTDDPSLILVVDDEPKNIQVVGSLLLRHGHEVIAAGNGPEALEKLSSARPDLILLDVMMPGMTGFDLCRILQADPETRDIPVIFLSAATDRNLVLDGLRHGGVDYITKPFHGPELLFRIELQSSLRKTRLRLAELIREKGRLLEIVAHDLKNPLSGIQFAATMLSEKFEGADPQFSLLVDSIREASDRAFEIISTLLETRGLEDLKSRLRETPVCLRESAAKAIRGFDQHLRSKRLTLDFHSGSEQVIVLGEDRTLLCCLENLISNAIKFSPEGASVVIQVVEDGSHGEFRIEDQGPGIRPDEIDRLFQKFTRLSARPTAGEASTGLGLHIVHELVTAMNGTVGYRDGDLGGARFTLKLPLAVCRE